MTTKQQILKEFDEKFKYPLYSLVSRDGVNIYGSYSENGDIKSFLSSSIDSLLLDLKERVEKLDKFTALVTNPYEVPPEMFDEVAKQTGLAHKIAIDSVLSLITSIIEEK